MLQVKISLKVRSLLSLRKINYREGYMEYYVITSIIAIGAIYLGIHYSKLGD
jgi:hypothetical protein